MVAALFAFYSVIQGYFQILESALVRSFFEAYISLLSKLLVIFLAVRSFETKSSGNCVDPSAECVVDVCQNIKQFRRILIQRLLEFCKIEETFCYFSVRLS